MPTRINLPLRNDLLAVIQESQPVTIRIYTGSQPASADDAATGTLLLTLTAVYLKLNAPANGVLTLDGSMGPYQAAATASGTAGWGRLEVGSYRIDGSVATSGAQFNLSSTSLGSGDPVTLQSCVITMPGA